MRYSQYFVKIAEIYPQNIHKSEKLLREAEQLSSPHIPYHLILCAKSWLEVFNSPDNAMRCLLEAECRCNDVRGFIEIGNWQIKLLDNPIVGARCLKKATIIAETAEDFMRLEEMFAELKLEDLAIYCRSRYVDSTQKNSKNLEDYRS